MEGKKRRGLPIRKMVGYSFIAVYAVAAFVLIIFCIGLDMLPVKYLLILGIVLALLISTSIHEICSLFTDDAEIRRIVASLALPFVLYQLGDGLQINFGNALRGIADVRPLMRYAFLCYVVVSLPLSYLLGFTFGGGPAGIWMSYPVALTLAGALFLRRFLHQTRAAAQSPAHH